MRRLKTPGKAKRKNLVGLAVRQLRLQQRTPITQQDLAARLQAAGVPIDQSAIARIECGDRGVSDLEAVAMAKALRVSISVLFSAVSPSGESK